MALRGNKHSTDHLSINLSVTSFFIIPSNKVISTFKISNRLAEQVEVSKRSVLTVMRKCRRKGKEKDVFLHEVTLLRPISTFQFLRLASLIFVKN